MIKSLSVFIKRLIWRHLQYLKTPESKHSSLMRISSKSLTMEFIKLILLFVCQIILNSRLIFIPKLIHWISLTMRPFLFKIGVKVFFIPRIYRWLVFLSRCDICIVGKSYLLCNDHGMKDFSHKPLRVNDII
jgi:hypothetical protein